MLVIGGGVTGAGVALDAASRGLRTALVERDDFASGTSSKSSKMVHGGLRYLQQRDFRLVYEALHERQRLLENAPHLVAPLPFLIPLFGKDGMVNKSVARAYATALTLYDLTGGLRIGKRHRRIGPAETLAHLPTLRTDRLVAGFIYYDARADDARLTLTIARTAALDHGAVIANYTDVRGLVTDASGQVRGARVRPAVPRTAGATLDDEDGATGEFEVRAQVVVNATGVWADEVRALDEPLHPHSIRPAKGIHITVSRSEAARRHRGGHPRPQGPALDLRGAVAGRGRRVPRHHRHRLGRPPRRPRLPARRRRLRHRRRQRRDHRAHRARRRDGGMGGTAPAPRSRPGTPRERPHRRPVAPPHRARVAPRHDHGDRRQAHHLPEDGPGHRGHRGEEPRVAAPSGAQRCRTKRLSLVGATGLEDLRRPGTAARLGVGEDTLETLVGRHGGETTAVLELATGRPELLETLVPGLPYLRAEALWAVRHEMAMTIDDVLARRTRSLLRRALAAAEAAPAVAELLAPEWGRDGAEVARDAAHFADQARRDLARAGLDPVRTVP